MIRVAVVGATGYAGAELVRILAGHPRVQLTTLTSRQFAGKRFDQVYPAMGGVIDLTCEEYNADRVSQAADIVFMALPHRIPMGLVPGLLTRGKRVIDLSADFRFNDAAVYESVYQPHTAGEYLASSVYGLSEIYFGQIRSAKIVGNPGCYPTSVLLPLIPLLKAGLLDIHSLVADSKSGVSGAGRAPAMASHFCEVSESFKPYKVAAHRHNPEMNAVLSQQAKQSVSITFVPHLVPMSRGMQTTIYATPATSLKLDDVAECYQSAYAHCPFIRLRPPDRPPDSLHVRNTNFCDIGFVFDAANNRLVLMSAIDNLVKGAAGQAVQNMNIMLGLNETTGLHTVPFPL